MFFLLLAFFFCMFWDFNSYVWSGRAIHSGVYFSLSWFFVCLFNPDLQYYYLSCSVMLAACTFHPLLIYALEMCFNL